MPQWSPDEWRKVWDGTIVVATDGTKFLHGGDRPGKGWFEKTEFPARWSREDMERPSLLAWSNPDATMVMGDRRLARKIIDGVMVEVQAYGPGYETFRASFPPYGEGVYLNGPTGRVEMPLDESLLDQEGWVRHEAT